MGVEVVRLEEEPHESKKLKFLELEEVVEQLLWQVSEEDQSFLVLRKEEVLQISTLFRLARVPHLQSSEAWEVVVDLGWIVTQHDF